MALASSSPVSAAASKQARRIIIGTAGHIDHGKTALVKALTGIDADRLQEEKRRGDRNRRPDKPDRPARPERLADQPRPQNAPRPERREKPIDPDSPFAALAALKAQLEARKRDG